MRAGTTGSRSVVRVVEWPTSPVDRPAEPALSNAGWCNGPMKLTIIGCSGSVNGPLGAGSSYLVEKDGYKVLLDLGTGACGPLLQHTEPQDIDQVVISHRHADHYGDLISLAYHRGRVNAPPLPLIGPSDLPDSVNWLTSEPSLFTFQAAKAGVVRAGPMSLRFLRVLHGDLETWGVRVDDALCYTADTEPCSEVDELAAGCEVLLAEACGLHGEIDGRHLTAREAGELATRSRSRLLVITHLRSWTDLDAILAEAVDHAPCPVVRALPGLAVGISSL